MNKQLKPCPFCGSPKTEAQHDDGLFWIKCLRCYSTGPATTKYSGAEDNFYRDWNTRTEETALAAKDARIAELEEMLRVCRGILENRDEDRWADAVGALLTNQKAEPNKTLGYVTDAGFIQAACKAATPSEDGREVPVVVGVRISSDGFGSYIADSAMGVGALYPGDVREPLMTVAQHERIVAAKDAEIAWLKTDLPGDTVADRLDRLADHSEPGSQRQSDLYAAATIWRKHLGAQPARQVGGDEREAFAAIEAVAWGIFADGSKDYRGSTKQRIEELRDAWQARAALAPAAVVSDTDIEMTAQLIYTQWDAVAGYVPWVKGGNSTQQDYARKLARDLLARLNRNAIPVELLERVCADRSLTPGRNAAVNAIDELRALLGKEGA